MTAFERALAAGGPLVAAWDHEDADRTRLALYRVGDAGATRVAQTEVPLDRQEDLVEQVRARDVRIGGTYAGTLFVWVADDQGLAVWTDVGRVASRDAPPPGVAAVNVFYDAADRGHRGVRLTLEDGTHELVVEQHDPAARLDLTYGQDNLYLDTLWARYLGEQLAVWCLVPLVDDISGGSIEADLTIARAARALAAEVVGAPASGEFEPIVEMMGAVGRASALALRFASDPSAPAGRVLELRVSSNGRTTDRPLKRGSNPQVAAFLRRVTTPATVLFAMNDVVRQHKRDGAG